MTHLRPFAAILCLYVAPMLRPLLLLAAVVLAGCEATLNESLSPGVVSRGRTATLAYRADASFAEFMSRSAWRKLGRTELRALDFASGGEAVEWSARGTKGRVKVSQPFAIARSECRRFEHVVEGRGERDTVAGVACKSDGGNWAYVS